MSESAALSAHDEGLVPGAIVFQRCRARVRLAAAAPGELLTRRDCVASVGCEAVIFQLCRARVRSV